MHLSPAWRCLPLLVLLFVCWILSCVADDISTEDGSGVTKLTLRPDVPARHRYLPAQQNSDDLPRHLLLLSGLQVRRSHLHCPLCLLLQQLLPALAADRPCARRLCLCDVRLTVCMRCVSPISAQPRTPRC